MPVSSLAVAAFPSTRLLPYSSTLLINTNSYVSYQLTRICIPFTGKSVKQITSAAVSNGVPLQTQYRSGWEDPDDGSDSDSDYKDEEDWNSEAEAALSTTTLTPPPIVTLSDEELIREVEQLLEPEEIAILNQNEAPDLSKLQTPKWGLLQSFALSRQIPFIDKLLEQGVHIDTTDKDGFSALHKAVIGKRESAISHLLRKGANPHLRDKHGATPLHYAAQVGALQTVKLLIKYKVDVNVADDEGWTPLHIAIQSRCRDIAKVLLINGADKTRRTNDGKTALDLSLCYGKEFKSYELAKLVKLVPADNSL